MSSIPYTWPSTPPRGDSSTQPEPPGLSEAARASLQARATLTPEQWAAQSTACVALIEEWRKQDGQEWHRSPGPANAHNAESPQAPMVLVSVFLSMEQQRVVQAVLHSESLFFTGSAAYTSFWGGTGTGKSVLLRHVIGVLHRKYRKLPGVVAVTATTGLVACYVSGTTVHAWAGIGLGCGSVDSLVRKVRARNNGSTWACWLQTRALVVDEISMLHVPFGGIQLVIAGNFFQLPPIGDNPQFASEGHEWDRVIKHTYELMKVWQQSHPGARAKYTAWRIVFGCERPLHVGFIDALRQIRLGDVTQAGELFIRQLGRRVSYVDGVELAELYPRRLEVSQANTCHLAMLPGDIHVYHTVDTGVIQEADRHRRLLGALLLESRLVLKVGAQVMLIKKGGQGLVNGSLRVLLRFDGPVDILPRDSGGVTIGKLRQGFGGEGSQYPIIRFPQPHRGGESQEVQILPEVWKVEAPMGETLVVAMDLRNVFEKGMVYVTLSRATGPKRLEVQNFDLKKVSGVRDGGGNKSHDHSRRCWCTLALGPVGWGLASPAGNPSCVIEGRREGDGRGATEWEEIRERGLHHWLSWWAACLECHVPLAAM
ncbi:hypothetical protein K439DRAFT_1622040 [Ramaria rubella]|nr:hypothetical protein K439DRAFT_1622040 [Ramaria rubella]